MNMKKFIIFSFLALTMSLFCASCVHKGDLNIEPAPKIDFSLTKVEGYTYTLTNISKDATNVKWAILTFKGSEKTVVCEGTGDSYTFTFPAIGTYWIQMSATREGREETIYTTKLIDKASVIKLDDGTFDDWNEITKPEFMMKGEWCTSSVPEADREGKNAFVDGKFDYDGDYVYFFVRVNEGYAGDPMAHMEGGDDGNCFHLMINSDGDLGTTGSTQGDDGYEYYSEFGFWNGDAWAEFIDTSSGWGSLPDGEQEKLRPGFVYGTTQIIDGKYCFEFGIDRAIFGINKPAFGVCFQITAGWDDCDALVDAEGNTDIVFQLVAE